MSAYSISRRTLISPLLFLGCLASLSGCRSAVSTLSTTTTASVPRTRLDLPSTVRVRVGGKNPHTELVSFEEYVAGSVLAEIGPADIKGAGIDEFLRTQAIMARTYALSNLHRHKAEGYDLCSSTHCQLFNPIGQNKSAAAARVRAAVQTTRGEVILFRDQPIQALYHSNCGGHTSRADALWGGASEPYLTAVEDSYCVKSQPLNWTWSIENDKLRKALDRNQTTDVGSRLTRLEVVDRDSVGRATRVALGGSRSGIVRSEQLRSAVNAVYGPHAIRSTWFSVERHGSEIVFKGRGYGHGVGLCQVGARARAGDGQQAESILAYYYRGTRVERLE